MECAPPAVLAPVLARLRTDAAVHYRIRHPLLVPLEYHDRPFSHVLRLAVHDGNVVEPLSHLFVKVTKTKHVDGGTNTLRERVAHDFETTRRVYESMLAHPDVGVVPPIACYPEHLAIVTEQVNGPTLQEYLEQRAAWFPSTRTMASLSNTLQTAGRWIRIFQHSAPAGDVFSLEELTQYIDHRLKKLVTNDPAHFTAHSRQAVLKHLDRLRSQVTTPELREVAVHSDLALGNILVNGRRIVVLDFGMTKTGCALSDVTRLYVQIQLLAVKPQMRVQLIRKLQEALLRGYDTELVPTAPLFRLFVVRHRINHLVTLRFDRASIIGSAYNRLVCRVHYRWLARELSLGPSVSRQIS